MADTPDTPEEASATFESLGLISPLLTALKQLKYHKPTQIQEQAIPYALQGRDIIGVAETVRLHIAFRDWYGFSPFFGAGIRENCCICASDPTKIMG